MECWTLPPSQPSIASRRKRLGPPAAPAGDHHPRWASAGVRRSQPPQRDRRSHNGGRRPRAPGSVGRRVPRQLSAGRTCHPASEGWRAGAARRTAGRPRSEWGSRCSQPAAGRTPRPTWASAPTSRGADDHGGAPGAARGRRPLHATGHEAARRDAARACGKRRRPRVRGKRRPRSHGRTTTV